MEGIDPKVFEKYRQLALERGIENAVVIRATEVATAPWVRMKCRYGCPDHGLRFSCPPYSPTPQETRALLDSYEYALLLHHHRKKGQKTGENVNEIALALERLVFLDGCYKALALGAGPCTLCKTCNTSGSCLHPESMRPSLEASGIDVFTTARRQGLPIRVVTSHADDRDFYALVLLA